MSRRSRKDIFPQILTVSTNSVASADYSVQSFSLPVSRIGGKANKATVVELVWVDYYPGILDAADAATNKAMYLTTGALHETADTATLITMSQDASHSRTLGFVFINKDITGGGTVATLPIRVSFTDGAGNGVLIGTDEMQLVYADTGGTTAAIGTAKIAYRLVEVGLSEYVGMVQSQANVTL